MSQSAEAAPPQPTAEHQRITGMAGRWKVACKFYMDPSQPPMETEAVETVETVGPFWSVSKFETNFMGSPFVGRATLGYDPMKKTWVSTWVDCMSPVFFSFTGSLKGDTLVMTGDAWSCATNSVARHRTTDRFVGPNEHVFEMFVTLPDGKEMKMMTTHYRRA